MIPLLSDQDEFLHTLMHAAQLQAGIRLNVVPGHVASYDPIHHRITCVLPTYIYPQTGEMRVSGWVPLFSIGCGSGWGIQIVPYGGSTQENLGAGEQVWLLVVDMETAAYVAAGFTWNAVMGTPFPNAQGGAQQHALSKALEIAKRELITKFRIDGDDSMEPMQKLVLSGDLGDFAGPGYYINCIEHSFDMEDGWYTHIHAWTVPPILPGESFGATTNGIVDNARATLFKPPGAN